MNMKVRAEYAAAKAALGGQLVDEPYKVVGDDGSMMFRIKRTGSRVEGKDDVLPGLMWDPFHFGQAVATRDELNRAVQYGDARANKRMQTE